MKNESNEGPERRRNLQDSIWRPFTENNEDANNNASSDDRSRSRDNQDTDTYERDLDNQHRSTSPEHSYRIGVRNFDQRDYDAFSRLSDDQPLDYSPSSRNIQSMREGVYHLRDDLQQGEINVPRLHGGAFSRNRDTRRGHSDLFRPGPQRMYDELVGRNRDPPYGILTESQSSLDYNDDRDEYRRRLDYNDRHDMSKQSGDRENLSNLPRPLELNDERYQVL